MLKINWETAPKGTYRENGTFEEGEVKLTFDQDPSRLTDPQKKYGIFCKVDVEFPALISKFTITLALEKSTELNCGGFKFRSVGVINADGHEIKMPVDFATSGKIFNTIHCNIIDTDGTIVSPEMHKLAVEIAEIGDPSRIEYKANKKAKRQSLKEMRQEVKPDESLSTVDMAGAVE